MPTSERPVERSPPVTHVAILEPGVLAQLDQRGWGLGRVVLGTDDKTTLELDRNAAFHDIFEALRADLARAKRKFPLAFPTSMMGFRLFDPGWLASEEMHFELIGVFNRLDRKAFYPGTCGEVRLLYRLAYVTEQGGEEMTSRLPLTVNVVLLVDDDGAGCAEVARGWQTREALTGEGLAQWLEGEGPLGRAARSRFRPKAVETNLQTIRLQSTVQTSLAGHIEYSMHVFHREGDAFVPAALENVPDVERLRHDAKLKAELLATLSRPEELAALDSGLLNLPERYLAKSAISVSPRGLTRLANRPFSRLFDEEDFAGLELSGYRTIRSPTALLRRLDGASCTGCHQSRSIAGFHHVGDEPVDAPAYRSLLHGSSSHLRADLLRREQYVASLASGAAPEEFRPLPERQGVGQGYGAPCGLGDPGLADWTCAAGLRCVALEDPDVGTCLADHGIGAPCEFGRMLPNDRPERDRVADMHADACSEGLSCDRNIIGFPLGSCETSCQHAQPNGVCSDFLDVDGYQNCLRGSASNTDCVTRFVFPTQLRACDDDNPCRQDYVCVRAPRGQGGACVPPYFVFPLRNDGYPLRR
ncbi:MAG TPA: hypothetical protein VLC09_19180 [Polyangiaceae bacterium]|nr:hypothetical protein [Polyangiaceae bacterium]